MIKNNPKLSSKYSKQTNNYNRRKHGCSMSNIQREACGKEAASKNTLEKKRLGNKTKLQKHINRDLA